MDGGAGLVAQEEPVTLLSRGEIMSEMRRQYNIILVTILSLLYFLSLMETLAEFLLFLKYWPILALYSWREIVIVWYGRC